MQDKNSNKTGFYSQDESKITFDEAEDLVEQYVREHKNFRTYIKTRDICNNMNIEPSMHNKVRIHNALEDKCESYTKSNGTRFKMPMRDGDKNGR